MGNLHCLAELQALEAIACAEAPTPKTRNSESRPHKNQRELILPLGQWNRCGSHASASVGVQRTLSGFIKVYPVIGNSAKTTSMRLHSKVWGLPHACATGCDSVASPSVLTRSGMALFCLCIHQLKNCVDYAVLRALCMVSGLAAVLHIKVPP